MGPMETFGLVVPKGGAWYLKSMYAICRAAMLAWNESSCPCWSHGVVSGAALRNSMVSSSQRHGKVMHVMGPDL